MTFTYETIVPWGRSFDEYRRMFDLSADDLNARILGCGESLSECTSGAALFADISCFTS